MFDDILKIKTHKEERALRYVEACRDKLARTEQAVLDAQKKLEEYRIFRREEKVNLFRKIQNEQVSMQKVDEVNRDIVKLKEQELEYIQQLENLRQEVLQVRDELEAARAAHRQAQANVQKYEEIIKEVDAEHKKEAERQEDLELEGVMARPGHTEM